MQANAKLRLWTQLMRRIDLPYVLAMDAVAFGEDAWTEQDYLSTLRKKATIGMCANTLLNEREFVCGAAVYRVSKRRERVTILRLMTHHAFRREGVASRLLDAIAAKHPGKSLVLDVPDHLLGAHLLLKGKGFRAECQGETYRFCKHAKI